MCSYLLDGKGGVEGLKENVEVEGWGRGSLSCFDGRGQVREGGVHEGPGTEVELGRCG